MAQGSCPQAAMAPRAPADVTDIVSQGTIDPVVESGASSSALWAVGHSDREAMVDRARRYGVEAERDPLGFERRLWRSAAIGLVLLNAGALAGLGVVAGLVVATFGHLMFLPFLVLVGLPLGLRSLGVLRTAWMSPPATTGIAVTRAEQPRLFACIDELAAPVGARRPHVIRVAAGTEASAVERRSFWFGPLRTEISVGLGFLELTPVEEVRAVLAHELGHLASSHSRRTVWILRATSAWVGFLDIMESWTASAGQAFRERVRPLVHDLVARTVALQRLHELAADAHAVRATSTEAVVSALIRTTVMDQASSRALGAFTRALVRAEEEPGPEVLEEMLELFRMHSTRGLSTDLDEILAAPGDPFDAHPGLADRIAAVGGVARMPGLPERPATVDLIEGPAALRERVAAAWVAAQRYGWAEGHRSLRAQEERLAELDRQERLRIDDHVERASILAELDRASEAATSLGIIDSEGDSRQRAFGLLIAGTSQVDDGDAAGVELLREAMTLDPRVRVPAAQALATYFDERDAGRSLHWHRVAEREGEILADAARERVEVRSRDVVTRPDLDDARQVELQTFIRETAVVKRAWLVQKAVYVMPELPFHVMVVQYAEKRSEELVQQELPLLAPDLLIVELRSRAWLAREAEELGARILGDPLPLVHRRWFRRTLLSALVFLVFVLPLGIVFLGPSDPPVQQRRFRGVGPALAPPGPPPADPGSFEAYLYRDKQLATENRYPEVVEMWTEYLTDHPEDGAAYFERGGAYSQMKEWNDALDDLARACELGHEVACAYQRRFEGERRRRTTSG